MFSLTHGVKIGQKPDSNCTGGIENIFHIEPRHLTRWAMQGIANHCEVCKLELTLGHLVYTRNSVRSKTTVLCIRCALPRLDTDDLLFMLAYKKQILAELERLKSEEMPIAVETH